MQARSTPSWPPPGSATALIGLVLAMLSSAAHGQQTTDVAQLTAAAEQDLAVVTVSYNGVRRDGLAYVMRAGDGLLIDADTLSRLAIRFDSSIAVEHDGRMMVQAAAISGLSWSFDAKQQHLTLSSDPRALAMNDITYQFTKTPPPILPNWGGFINYGIFGSTGLNGTADVGFADTLGAGLTTSIFGPYGVGTASFLVNSRSTTETPQSVTVLDVNWRWDDIATKTTLLVGDAVSTPGWWGRALRFGGVQYGTNYALQPGFVTYPLMAVAGLASVPSTADILINNVRVAEQPVPAGPFTISNLPTMTGAGELSMVVRDPFGQERVITQPFYIAQQLLRPGLTEFSVGAGAGRVDYGLENFDYDGAFAYGWVRHGIDFNVTGELRGEADSNGAAVGAGADLLVGDLGVASVGAAASQRPRGNGTRYLLGFDRQTPFLSFGAHVTRASPDYREIGDTGPLISQASAAFIRTSFGRYGSLAFGYAGQRYHDADPLTLYSAIYSFNVGARAYMTLTGSKILGVQNQTQALALLTIPLDTLTSATVSLQTIRHDSETTRIGEAYVQRSLPVGEGYGYYVRANTEHVAAGGVQYAGPVGRYTLEAATDNGHAALRAAVTGGIAWVGDTVMFAQPIEQSFAVVRVADLDGVRVLQSNQDVGRTEKGELALSQVPSLTGVTIAIDPLTVPIDVTLERTTQQIVTLPRTGVIVDFPAKHERNALVRLALPSGSPAPIGAVVQIDGRPERFPVGHDGEVYLTRLDVRQGLVISFNGTRCRLTLVLDPDGPANADIGPLRCELSASAVPGGTR
jgi:outer membrane usher protein